MKVFLSSVVALLAGLAAGYWLRPDPRPQLDAARAEVTRAEAEKATALQQVQAANAEVARLNGELTAAQEATKATQAQLTAAQAEITLLKKPPLAEPPSPEEQREHYAAMLRRIGHAHASQRLDDTLSALKQALNLTPEQAKKVRALIESQAAGWKAALDRFVNGHAQPGDFAALARLQRGVWPAEVASVFTDEQKPQWEAFHQDERTRRINDQTTREVQALQAAAGLTTEQADQARIRLGELATVDDAADWEALKTAEDVRAFFDGAFERRVTALQPLLTAVQMEIYRRQLDAQRQWLGRLTGAAPSPEKR